MSPHGTWNRLPVGSARKPSRPEAPLVASGKLPGAGAPSAQAGDPIEMLSHLHARTLQQCESLRQLTLDVAEHGCDDQTGRTAKTLLRYFDVHAPQYCSDEEEDLF